MRVYVLNISRFNISIGDGFVNGPDNSLTVRQGNMMASDVQPTPSTSAFGVNP